MATDNNYDEILEEICEKVNNIEPIKEIDILNIKSSIESLEELITDTEVKANFDDIKEKLEAIAMQVDNCNDALLKDLYTDINQLKDSSADVGQHLENLQNLQNLSLTSAQFEEYQKQQLDLALKTNENIFNELTAIKENSKVIDYSENINNLNTQLTNLHTTLTNYIEQLTTKIEGTPNLEEISSVMSDLGSVQQKSIKQTKVLIKEFQEKFTTFQSDFKYKEIENQFSKISEIYDSLNIIRVWIEKVGYINKSIENVYARLGQSIDFDDVAEKVDIIYENIGSLNTWTQKIDNIDSTMTNTQTKLSSLSEYVAETKNISTMISHLKDRFNSTFSEEIDFDDLSNKMDIAYENLTALNEWATKIDVANSNINTTNEKIDMVTEKVDQINTTLEDEMIASKVDIIYENIGLLNEWVSKIDDISQKSEELDNKYTQTSDNLNLKIDEITQTLVNASRIIEDVPNIKDKLEDLSGELNIITHSTKDDAESYIYTLLDIESDFLKLHKFLDDKTQTTTKDINALKEKFTELTDDISSISIRTNKLILSADDANKEFKSYLDSFRATIQELDNQKNLYNPELKLSLLDEKVNSMFGLMQSNLDTTKNLKSAFVFLAEWVDATGAMLNNMQDNINKLLEQENEKAATSETETRITRLEDYISTAKAETDAKLATIEDNVSILKGEDVSEIKSTLTGIMMQLNTSLTPDIDLINERMDKVEEEHNEKFTEVEELMKEKIEEQEKHINALEEKLNDMNTKFDDMNSKFDKLMEIVSENHQSNEIKDILNYIATQTAATNEAVTNQQGTTDVVKEVAEKLTSFDENINKIVSYIEEE